MSDSKLTPPQGNEPMSLRECRLILERLLVVAGTDPGMLPATREALLDAVIVRPDLLAVLHADDSLLRPARSIITVGPAATHVDGGGAYGLLLAPALRDLVLVGLLESPRVVVDVANVVRPEDLDAFAVHLRDEGVQLDVVVEEPHRAQLRAHRIAGQRAPTQYAEALARAVEDGLHVAGHVWLDLYLRSNDALVPDSATTRRHAGHQDVDETGRIVRQMDDDRDLERALLERTSGDTPLAG